MTRNLKEYPAVILKLENLQDKINFARIFGRSWDPPKGENRPLHIEIGTGKGTFLLNEAKAQPNVNFIGIERANKYYRHAVDRIGRWGLENVRIVRTEAATFLAGCVPDACVDCFHVYFPDPWPKRRHNKRRFLNDANLQQLWRCLRTNGRIKIATDHAYYFQQIRSIVSRLGHIFEEIGFSPAAGAEPGELTGTNYERKFIKDQRQVYALALKKR